MSLVGPGLDDWSNIQLLTVAARVLQRDATEYLTTLGLPRLGLYILEYLAERSPILQSELAGLVLARTQTIGRILTRLEGKQWITREHGLTQNQVAVAIAHQGRTILATAQERLRALQPGVDVESLRPALQAIIQRAACT